MRNAATAAGFEKVQLLLEPLCAAALDIQMLKEAGCLEVGLSAMRYLSSANAFGSTVLLSLGTTLVALLM